MPGKYLTDVEKGQIIAYRNSGKTINDIVRIMHRSRNTISSLLKAARDLPPGQVPERKTSPGRPRLLNVHDERLMARAFRRSPRKSCRKLKEEFPETFGHVKVRTLRDYCVKKLNYRSRVARKKPLLTDIHIAKRLEFARKYANWTKEQWRKVMWSDESNFVINYETPKRVRRPAYSRSSGSTVGDPYQLKYLKKTVKHPAKLMVWAAFTGEAGRGSLYFLKYNTTLNSAEYLEKILKEKLVETMEIHGATHFVQDGASIHNAKIVKDWLAATNIPYFKWPPQSPDLNPIENMWYHMKRQLENYDTSNLTKLEAAIKELWCRDMSLSVFMDYANSMPKRIKEVLQRKGGHTHY